MQFVRVVPKKEKSNRVGKLNIFKSRLNEGKPDFGPSW